MQPRIGLTMGDASGVGPEVIAKALAHRDVYARAQPLVIGDAQRMQQAMTIVKSPQRLRIIADVAAWHADADTLDCVAVGALPADLPFGKLSAAAGDAAYRYLERAHLLATEHAIDAVCTAPLNKEALHAGGHLFPGHTEIFAALTGTSDFAMMLTAPRLRVIHVTTHVGLIDAIARITPARVERVVRLADETLRRAGIAHPRIAVCGINPHAGENGLFGNGEEAEKIVPALERVRADGIDAQGPLPADTLFFRATRGDFDIVVAMYHDQGHGPVKVLGLEAGVNITVGLPYVRTSVDHGTAFDIAGTGTADERSMLAAIDAAIDLAPKRESQALRSQP